MAQPARQPVTISGDLIARILFAGRSSSLSAQIVNQVRDALFAKQLKPGDFLGTERIWPSAGVSRIVARDALRTLEAMGMVEIRVGAGGGARIAKGNPLLFAEALAVQLDLTGVTPPRSWTRNAPSKPWAPNSQPKTRPGRTSRNCARFSPKLRRRSATSTASPVCRAIFILRSRRPRRTACWRCS